MQKVKKIGVLSLAKILGLLYAIFGLIIGALFALFPLIGFSADETGAFFGTASIILFPILYGIMGFIGGLITAFFYNLIAGKIGGLEVEIAK